MHLKKEWKTFIDRVLLIYWQILVRAFQIRADDGQHLKSHKIEVVNKDVSVHALKLK